MRMIKIVAQNRDRLQKTNSAKKSITAATPYFAMIRHQNALAMFLAILKIFRCAVETLNGLLENFSVISPCTT